MSTQIQIAGANDPLIGTLVGGGILVGIWNESGVKKGLIASLTNLSTSLPYTIPAFQTTLIGPTAQSLYDGASNTAAIIAQTGAAPTTAYAAGIAKLHSGGGYNDWYLPSSWELNMCYNSAAVVNKVLGANGFINNGYWGSSEWDSSNAWMQNVEIASQINLSKSLTLTVRAVRTHTF